MMLLAEEWTQVHSSLLNRKVLEGPVQKSRTDKGGEKMSRKDDYEQRAEKLLTPIVESKKV